MNINALSLVFLFVVGSADASCLAKDVSERARAEVTAQLNSSLDRSEYLVQIVQPPGIKPGCIVFWSLPDRKSIVASFELELPGQLGLHIVTLSQDYLVVESGTADGSFLAEIFAVRQGGPVRLAGYGSATPPNFTRRGGRDFILTTDGVTKKTKWTSLSLLQK